MLQQAFGEDCLSRTQCHEWYRRFKSGRTSVEDDPKTGRPSTSMDDDHVEKVLAVIRQNRRLTVREVAEEAAICKSSCHLILTEKLQIRRVAASADRCTAYPWIFDEAWDGCWPSAALLSRFGPSGLFLVLEVEVLTKRSPISESRGDRRKFDTGPSRQPAKHVPGRVPGLDKMLGAVYQGWRGVLWRGQVWLTFWRRNYVFNFNTPCI